MIHAIWKSKTKPGPFRVNLATAAVDLPVEVKCDWYFLSQ